jgi:dipeptidyl aminopeptidase/acylaminoacyl peptidase
MKKCSLLVCLVLFIVSVPGANGHRFITENDLLKFTWIADPQISPDGATVAFVRVTVNEKENRYETSLFAVPASGAEAPRRLTSGIRDTTPRPRSICSRWTAATRARSPTSRLGRATQSGHRKAP